jgi:hypothetical protein
VTYEALKEKSIGIIIPDFDYGGEEKRALFFANHYASHFKKVYLFAPAGAQTRLIDSRVQQVQLRQGIRKHHARAPLREGAADSFIQGHKRTTFPYLYAIEKFTEPGST